MISTLFGSLRLLSSRERFWLLLIAASRVVTNGLDVVGLVLLGWIGAIALGSRPKLPDILESRLGSGSDLTPLLFFAVVLFISKAVISVALSRIGFRFIASVETKKAAEIAARLFNRDLESYSKVSAPEIEWSVLRSTDLAFSRVLTNGLTILAEGSLFLAIVVLFFLSDWQAALFVFVYFAGILSLFQIASGKTVSRGGTNVLIGSVGVDGALRNLMNAFPEITVSGAKGHYLKKVSELRALVAESEATNRFLQSLPRQIVEVGLIVGALAFAVFHSSRAGQADDLTYLGVFLVGSLRLMSSMLPIQRAIADLIWVRPQALSAQEILGEDAHSRSVAEHPHEGFGVAFPERPTTPLSVEFRGVNYSYASDAAGAPMLRNINFKVDQGTFFALIGPSGGGKSTILNLMVGLNPPTSGEVTVSGIPPIAVTDNFPGSISIVPQTTKLLSTTLAENVALGKSLEEINWTDLKEALELAEISEFVGNLPQKEFSLMGAQGNELSGGQLQRLGIARALYSKPQLLVLDEATSSLDVEVEASLGATLRKLRGKLTLVVVAHRLSTIQHADQIGVVENGTISALGTMAKLRESKLLVKKYIELSSLDETS